MRASSLACALHDGQCKVSGEIPIGHRVVATPAPAGFAFKSNAGLQFRR